jgi:phosphatidylserine decarboxylase
MMSEARSRWVSFISGTVALATAAALTVGYAGAVPLAFLAAFFTYFFRDPDRESPPGEAGLSPADGRVLVAGPPIQRAPPGEWKQISIFLSPIDVHVNRLRVRPVTAWISSAESFCPRITRTPPPPTSAARSGWIIRPAVVFRQIVGILARRVVCRVQPGAQLKAGQRFGIMKFGSRMDVFFRPMRV